ncbi:nuclear transport factor 2 family protein [uncultured Roseibium sp.]|uniref:nuclear transport factor 2 family protein n=1 Tax=uncultured Roseibium sp. TaxID=1936171 RepID=UPI002606491E|nr:nuclear transport factor 2 family protein [uncultured Roseibium sp.]
MTTEEVVRNAIQSYNRADVEAISALLHDDIHYRIHANAETAPYCADCGGKTAFWEAIGRIQSDWSIDDYRLTDIIVSGERAATQISLTITSRHTGVSRETELALFWTVKDGCIVELHEYHDTAAAALSK